MTPKELQDELRAIRTAVGPHAYVSGSVDLDGGKPLHGSIYPNGLTKNGYMSAEGHDWPELFANMRAKWAEHCDTYRAENLERMALLIISTVNRIGKCPEAALRSEFDAADVMALSEEALALANTMAANGPFSIERSANSNSTEAA